jgi:hypothetical protein
MDASPQVVSLARTLLALWRAGGTGVLQISAGGKRCRIAIRQGAAHAATSSADSTLLGDWLLRRGELDLDAHAAALRQGPAGPLVGAWLVARGIATREAVERALSDQLRARVLAALRWRDLEYRFESGATDVATAGPERAIALGELALDAARQAFEPADFNAQLRANAERRAQPSAFGRALLDDPILFSNAALPALLRRGASFQQLAHACDNVPADFRTLGALCWLAAIIPVADGGGSYRLLLRKHVQLQRRVSPAELLELDRDASPVSTRKALRRLASRLHPDTLGPTTPALLRDASHELMSALVRAEQQLRAR